MNAERIVKFLKETDSEVLASYMWELKKRTSCGVRLEGESIIFDVARGHNPDSIIAELRKIVSF